MNSITEDLMQNEIKPVISVGQFIRANLSYLPLTSPPKVFQKYKRKTYYIKYLQFLKKFSNCQVKKLLGYYPYFIAYFTLIFLLAIMLCLMYVYSLPNILHSLFTIHHILLIFFIPYFSNSLLRVLHIFSTNDPLTNV